MSRVYVGSINFELTEEHIYKVFAEFGSVRSVSMSKDPATGRHKGFGFVEYDVPEAATLAMEVMNGTMLGGRQLKIGRPNNYTMAVMQGFPQPPDERIYVANVNEAISEDSLREIFAPFGEIKACILAPDMVLRKPKGWGFIEFADPAAAEQAALAMNGFSLGNLVLRV
ncbi:the first Two Rrm domains of Fir in the complex with Fbp Nbox peptide, partial [Martensiomyces pterosporus]